MEDYFENPAPAAAHQRMDRLWLCREPEGQIGCTAVVKDPDNSAIEYILQITLTREEG